MGFSIKEIKYKQGILLFLARQEYAGPWFSFTLREKHIRNIPVILKNIEPTPIYKIVNTKAGTAIGRITLDFDIKEYLEKLTQEGKLTSAHFNNEKVLIRMYIDIFLYPKVPYMITYFTLKNNSDFDLTDFSMYFIFDFDINGLEGFDDDLSGYDAENDVIYQYDKTKLYGGFSTISKSTHYESCLSKDFRIDSEKINLSNTLHEGEGEILSALQIEFKTLLPGQSVQTALVLSGGFNKDELVSNIQAGKKAAISYIKQVNRSIMSEQRNLQEEAFLKLNVKGSKNCDKT